MLFWLEDRVFWLWHERAEWVVDRRRIYLAVSLLIPATIPSILVDRFFFFGQCWVLGGSDDVFGRRRPWVQELRDELVFYFELVCRGRGDALRRCVIGLQGFVVFFGAGFVRDWRDRLVLHRLVEFGDFYVVDHFLGAVWVFQRGRRADAVGLDRLYGLRRIGRPGCVVLGELRLVLGDRLV